MAPACLIFSIHFSAWSTDNTIGDGARFIQIPHLNQGSTVFERGSYHCPARHGFQLAGNTCRYLFKELGIGRKQNCLRHLIVLGLGK
jgi:hypothetical protein